MNTWLSLLCATGVILGACYMLYLYRRVIFGKLTKSHLADIADLSPREMAVFAPLVVLVIVMGVYPPPFLDVMHTSVANLIDQVAQAKAAAASLAVAGR